MQRTPVVLASSMGYQAVIVDVILAEVV